MSDAARLKAEAYAKRAAMVVAASKLVTDTIVLHLVMQGVGILVSGACFIAGLIMLAQAMT